MSEKVLILNPQWPLHVNAKESPAAANSAFCCYFCSYWEFRLLLSKPCGWLLIKTLEAASSLTDRNAIQGQSRNTLSDLTYTIETNPSAMTFILLLDGFRNSRSASSFICLYRDTGELDFSSFQFSGAIVVILLNRQQKVSYRLNVSGITL